MGEEPLFSKEFHLQDPGKVVMGITRNIVKMMQEMGGSTQTYVGEKTTTYSCGVLKVESQFMVISFSTRLSQGWEL